MPARLALVRRVRGAVPEPLRERARRVLATRLERRLLESPATRGAAIVLHSVAPRGGDPRLEIDPPVAADALERAVSHLSRRYRPVTAAELPSAARARAAGEPIPVAVTFDDDLPSHVEHALPVLRRHGAAATAFLCGARSPFWWQLLQVAMDRRLVAPEGLPPLPPELVEGALERRPRAIGRLAQAAERLSPDERDALELRLRDVVADGVAPPLGPDGAAALADAGWELGAHTPRHHLLTALDDETLADELERRPDATGELPRTLAYPHGKAAEREARAARAAGYEAAYTGRSEVFTAETDPHLIGRLQPDTTTLGRFALELARALTDPDPDPT
ncbi:MAG TPA: polysaccharide deacetylase family protein [Thermoleophilaceae bacterium]